MKKTPSRHPKIQYWSFTEKQDYREQIDRLAENGCFDTLCLSFHSMNNWDPDNKPLIKEVVEYAVSRGFRVPMQAFPMGFNVPSNVGVDDAAALVTEYECTVCEDVTVIRTVGGHARYKDVSTPLASELLAVYAFRSSGDGFYEPDSLTDITDRASVIVNGPESLEISVDTAGFDGCTLYAMAAHYYAFSDLFSDFILREYKELMDAYADVPLAGIVLDEFKNMPILPPWQLSEFRERFYGKNFRRYFAEQTGDDLIRTMFDMRFCPCGKDEIRIRAINRYFDIFLHSTRRVEKFVAEYSEKIWGENAFAGLHNTYHNHLQNDEIWQTCCNWWDVPRKYAQTDENIAFPVRMGIAAGCPESICYDMYYSAQLTDYLEKAMRDARFGCRIHYHIIYSDPTFRVSSISWNTGHPEFLAAVKPYEEKIELLNRFEPVMPKMELLVVFGFSALCNWYPDHTARSSFDINRKLNIMDRVQSLWEKGCLNALVPDTVIADGRVTVKDGCFDYCGHRFDKLLYLYPEYSKGEVLSFLQNAIDDGCDLKILGGLTRDFDGAPASLALTPDMMLAEDADIPAAMKLVANPIDGGCELEDGSVVMTDYTSVTDGGFCTRSFRIGEHSCKASFRGVFAVRLDADGRIEKLAAGNLNQFRIDGRDVLTCVGEDVVI